MAYTPVAEGDIATPAFMNARFAELQGVEVINVKSPTYGAAGDGTTDDLTALQAAHDALSTGAVMFLPQGTYLIGSQLALSKDDISVVAEEGTRILLKASTTLSDGPSGVPTAIHVTGDNVALRGFTFDGNKANNTQDIAGIAVTGDDFRADHITVYNCEGSAALGAGIRLQGVIRAWLSDILAYDNNSNGIHVFGDSTKILAQNCHAYNNGLIGFEVEGSGSDRPSLVTITNLISTGNLAQNFLVKLADDVCAHGLITLAGGNNGNVKIIYSTRVIINGFNIRDALSGAAAPHGIWIHQEGSPGGASQDIILANGIISSMGDGVTRGDGIRLTDAVDNLIISNVQSIDGTGYGFSVDSATFTPSNVQIFNSDFSGNSLGTVDNWTSITGTTHLFGCTPGLKSFLEATLDLTGGSVLQVAGTQVVSARQTGWSAPAGTATRTSFDTASVTTEQLAERVHALIDDLITHGLIGA